LELWLRADALSGYVDTDDVETWPDESGEGNDATQATEARRPLYRTNSINSLPALYFDNSDDGMRSATSLANPYSVFVVYAQTGANTARRAVQGVTNNWLIGPYTGFHRLYNGAFITGGAVAAGTYVYATVIGTAAGASFRLNGAAVGNNANTTAPSVLALGNAGAYNERLDGRIAEVIAYSAALSTADRDLVEAYLAEKYGL
jgi:hypothetical protein